MLSTHMTPQQLPAAARLQPEPGNPPSYRTTDTPVHHHHQCLWCCQARITSTASWIRRAGALRRCCSCACGCAGSHESCGSVSLSTSDGSAASLAAVVGVQPVSWRGGVVQIR